MPRSPLQEPMPVGPIIVLNTEDGSYRYVAATSTSSTTPNTQPYNEAAEDCMYTDEVIVAVEALVQLSVSSAQSAATTTTSTLTTTTTTTTRIRSISSRSSSRIKYNISNEDEEEKTHPLIPLFANVPGSPVSSSSSFSAWTTTNQPRCIPSQLLGT